MLGIDEEESKSALHHQRED